MSEQRNASNSHESGSTGDAPGEAESMVVLRGWLELRDHGRGEDDLYDRLWIVGDEVPDCSDRDDGSGETLVAEWAYEKVPRSEPVTVRYWTADAEVGRDDIAEDAIRSVAGAAEAVYQSHYSETTGYLWTDETFLVGGHNMIRRLSTEAGRFLHLEVAFDTEEEHD